MTILIIGPAGIRWKTEHYIARAFRQAGHRVFWFNDVKIRRMLRDRTDAALQRFVKLIRPDFVLAGKAQGLKPETLGRICHGRQSSMWYFDLPVRIPEDLLARAREVGTFFTTNRGMLEFYRSNGIRRPLFLPQACDGRIHRYYPPKKGKIYSVSFVGSIDHSGYRRDFLTRIAAGTGLHVWGKSNEGASPGMVVHRAALFNADLARVIGSSFAVVGINSLPTMNHAQAYASNRIWLTLGCGGFFLGYRNPGLDILAAPGKYFDDFETADELIEKIAFYRLHPELREKIRAAGYSWAHAHHTYAHRIANLLAGQEF